MQILSTCSFLISYFSFSTTHSFRTFLVMYGVNVYCVILSPSHSMAQGPLFKTAVIRKRFSKNPDLNFLTSG